MREPDSQKAAERIDALMRELLGFLRTSGGGGLPALHRLNLTMPQFVSLQIMRDGGPQTVSALARRVQLTPGAVSRLVDQLVGKRLVHRTESEKDRRQKVLQITPAGARLIGQLESARAAGMRRLFGKLDDGLAADLERVLTRVVRALKGKQAGESSG